VLALRNNKILLRHRCFADDIVLGHGLTRFRSAWDQAQHQPFRRPTWYGRNHKLFLFQLNLYLDLTLLDLRVYLAADKYTTMPRLSLYKPEKGNDYKFIDRQIGEMFQIGGTDLYLHKYIGVNTSEENATAAEPHYDALKETNIQDLLLLENRDRKYDPSIYKVRGIYNVQNLDFNLSQFGLFIDNDTVFMTVHINDWISTVGRKPISGDVLHLMIIHFLYLATLSLKM